MLQRGFWAAFSIYPSTKMGNVRMVEILRKYGAERDHRRFRLRLGHLRSARRAQDGAAGAGARHAGAQVRLACYGNALAAYGQSGQMKERDWLDPPAIDQRTLYEGNSVLRGGREPLIEEPKARRGMKELIDRMTARATGAAALPGLRPVLRLTWIFLGLAILVALPFFIWGDAARGGPASGPAGRLVPVLSRLAWLIAIALLVSDLVLPIPNTMVIAALGVIYGPLVGGLVATARHVPLGAPRLCALPPLRTPARRPADRRGGPRKRARSFSRAPAASSSPHHAGCRCCPKSSPAWRAWRACRCAAFTLALVCGAAPLGFVVGVARLCRIGPADPDARPLRAAAAAALVFPARHCRRTRTLSAFGQNEKARRAA